MAWQEPKTNWQDADVVTKDDINRIEGNTAELKTATDGKMDKSGGTFTGIVTAHSNTSYTTKQVRNIILSTADADVNLMSNGDIWIKYKA